MDDCCPIYQHGTPLSRQADATLEGQAPPWPRSAVAATRWTRPSASLQGGAPFLWSPPYGSVGGPRWTWSEIVRPVCADWTGRGTDDGADGGAVGGGGVGVARREMLVIV